MISDNKTEGILAILAALFVLFSALFDSRISVIIAVAALVGLGIVQLVQNRKAH